MYKVLNANLKKGITYPLNFLLGLLMLFDIFNIAPVFSQSAERATPELWKKLIVGNTTFDQYVTYKWHENGIMTGSTRYKGVTGDVMVLYTFSEKEGFCRMNGKVTFSDGRARGLPRKCTKNVFFHGQKKVVIDGKSYQILWSSAVTQKNEKINNDFSTLKKEFLKLSLSKRTNLQEIMKGLNFYFSNIDGLHGRGTEKALREYNKKYLFNSDLKKKHNVSTLLAKLKKEEVFIPKVVAKKVEETIEVVATKTDTKKINKEWQLLAEEGSAMAQHKLASIYEQGEGLLKDFVYAHMWANISATNGYAEAKYLRDALEKR